MYQSFLNIVWNIDKIGNKTVLDELVEPYIATFSTGVKSPVGTQVCSQYDLIDLGGAMTTGQCPEEPWQPPGHPKAPRTFYAY